MLPALKHWLNGLPPWFFIAATSIVVLVSGALSMHGVSLYENAFQSRTGDDWEYYRAADSILHGQVPYRGFPLEYPPLSIIEFLMPMLLTAGHPVSFATYYELLPVVGAIEIAVFTLVLWDTAKIARISSTAPLTANLVFVAILSPLLPWRFDLFPALLTLLAMRSLLQGRSAMAGVWLGLGVAAKLYPAVLLPIMAAYCGWGEQDRDLKGAIKLLASCLATAILSALPFAVAGGPKFWSFVQYHQHRGIEIESISAVGLFIAHYLDRLPILVIFNYGANHLVASPAATILRCLPLAAALALGLTSYRAAIRFRAEASADAPTRFPTLALHLTAILLAFIVTNKVFSPQYLIWLLPFAAFLPSRHAAVLGIIGLLTIGMFPFFFDYVVAGQPWALALLCARNLLVVGLFVGLLAHGQRRRLASTARPRPLVQTRSASGITP